MIQVVSIHVDYSKINREIKLYKTINNVLYSSSSAVNISSHREEQPAENDINT